MYAETELFFPDMQNFAQDFELFEECCKTQKPNASMKELVQTSAAEYNLEEEVDMFRALDPIIEEPIVGLDPMTAAMCGEDVITSEGLKAADIESFPNEQLLDVLCEYEKDLMANAAIQAPLAAVLDFETPVVEIDENLNQENELLGDASFQKRVSSGGLSSMGSLQGAAIKPNFLDFPVMDFGSVYTMRRAFSEGDIKTLGNGNLSGVIHSPVEQPLTVSSCSTEDRREKLSRYRNKKTKRNFRRKIKYACRKALADSQPRIHGRFAKIEESDNSKRKLLLSN
ncbi:HSP20-like chaperones superfamily protein isoform 1 [Hibiscus syriacus]|uniref:HSP20-like chaperones superfamily protein isoform 1 n=1 Tax=Hibiscus syriacus TaxID=106335 RepID=A0A6A2XPV8_HIBSY|nr:zinc finger protein CONSTANS-LIKE 13-like [Hibiscus syriacus]KAE8664056.1 HSP20-like chaperones superfamily protein isoform 1 [Hibiscus syriacus]